MRIYVGCPIDQSRLSPLEQMEALVKRTISVVSSEINEITGRPHVPVVYNPLLAWANASAALDQEELNFVWAINQEALKWADLGVFLWSDSPSFGVPIEINSCNKRVLVVNTSGRAPGLYMRRAIQGARKGAIVDNWGSFDDALRQVISP